MDGSCKKENFFTGVVKSTVSDSLEKRLPPGEQRQVVNGVAYPAVPSYLFFVSRNFYERSIIFIEIYLNHNRY